MRRVLHISSLLILVFSLCIAEELQNIALYNFTSSKIPSNDRVAYELANKLQSDLVDLMKKDFQRNNNFYFIPTKQLNREMQKTQSLLLQNIQSHLKSDIITVATNDKIEGIIKSASKNRLSDIQLDVISDSLMIFISKMTKEVTKDMIMSNIIELNQPQNITMRDFFNFISISTETSIRKNTLSSFIASSSNKFEVDVIAVGEYEIDSKRIKVDFYIYDYRTLDFLSKVTAENAVDKVHILIKDLEFKLLKQMGANLDDDLAKAEIIDYNIDNFNKSDNSLYLSRFFSADDIQELKIRFQFNDDYDLISYYYKSLFESLMNTKNKIPFYLKFYNNDSLYPLKKINSVDMNSVNVSFSKTKGIDLISDGSIDYTNIQGIKFGKD